MTNKETYTDQILDKLDRLEARINRMQKEEQKKQEKDKHENSLSFGAQYAKEYSEKFE